MHSHDVIPSDIQSQTFQLHPYFVCRGSEGSGKSVHTAGSPKPLLLNNAINNKILCAGAYYSGFP